MSLNITKTGLWNGQIVEPFLTLSDGSKWQLICAHLIDKGNRLFTQANAGYCNDFGLYSRCQYADAFQYNNLYEFYIIQDGVEMRWTQTNAPSATTPSGFTAITGNPVQGLVRQNGNTYYGYNAWWGAVGCWTSYTLSGKKGIPGFGSHDSAHIAVDHLIVYARIETPHAFAEDGIMSGTEIYEY